MPEKENNGGGMFCAYMETPGGYVPLGEIVSVELPEITGLTEDEALGKAEAELTFRETVFTEEMQELIPRMIAALLPEIQIAIRAAAEGLCGLMEQIWDYIGGEYDGLLENLAEAKDLAYIHREEVKNRRDLQRRFERETRAKMKQYRNFQAGSQRSKRTGKRYREWRGPARQR